MERELTQEAKKVLTLLAQEETKKFHSLEILPEHVILAILKMEDGNAVKALEQIGVSVSEMQVEVERSIPRLKGGLLYGEKPPSRRSQEMLANSQREAGRMGQEYIGTEHLLLGVIQEETCVVSRYLAKCNVATSVLREVIQQVSTGG
jgi:ATP-dependent Clp protease ATP-binding subunit ClpC